MKKQTRFFMWAVLIDGCAPSVQYTRADARDFCWSRGRMGLKPGVVRKVEVKVIPEKKR